MEKLKYRKGVFLVVFRKEHSLEKNPRQERAYKIFYLLLKRKLHWKGWEFPKGGIERGESKLKAVKRELREETGLKAGKIINIKVKGKFLYPRLYPDRPGIKGMIWKLFAVEVKGKKIKLDRLEHSGYKWLEYKETYKKLSFNDKKKCLKLVNDRFNK